MDPLVTVFATYGIGLPSTVKGQDTFVLDDPVQPLEAIPVHEPLSDWFCSIRSHPDQDDLYAASRQLISSQSVSNALLSLHLRPKRPDSPAGTPNNPAIPPAAALAPIIETRPGLGERKWFLAKSYAPKRNVEYDKLET
jgi:hypothetical protein